MAWFTRTHSSHGISNLLPLAALILAFTSVGCGDDDGLTSEIPAQCNPLGGVACITPWPSAVYAIDDSTSATGRRLAIEDNALPTNIDGITVDASIYNSRDGFSFAAPMIHVFPGGVDDSNLVHFTKYADSLTDSSPTVIINMATGERVTHFAELDQAAAADPDFQALYIRPATRLDGSTRYLVAIRKSLKSKRGGDLPISPGFEAILSGKKTNHPLLEKVRPRYDAIFAALEAEGISRDDLVVAWDFTTASDESIRSDILTARDLAIPEMGTAGANLSFSVDRTDADNDPDIRWRIEGTYQAPLFLTLDGRFNFETTLARDAAGKPAYQGMYDSPFVAVVPECAYAPENRPVGVIIYGHGLFGAANQVASGSQKQAAVGACRVVIGTDLRGMSEKDVGNVAIALNNLSKSPNFFYVIVQGIINTIALEHIVRGPMATDLFVDDMNQSIIDPNDVVYYGNSQGHIFGSTFVAFDPFVKRAVLGVGGANYSMMLERSSDWPTYGVILAGAYPRPLDQAIGLNLVQMFFDFTDPVSSSNDMLTGKIPGTPEKQVLLHMAVGDHQVPNITMEYQARMMGIPVLTPAPYMPYGIPEADANATSAMVIWDNGQGPGIQRGNIPPVGSEDPHGMPRKQPAAVRQMAEFWNAGTIENTCGDTACFCLDGACD